MEILPDSQYQPILKLSRGETVESIHYGAMAVVNSKNELVASYGDPEAVTFLRSSAKPFQALPFVEQGGVENYRLTQEELALICASHQGTDEHVAVAKSIQAKAGVKETDLLCGMHMPYHRATYEAMKQRGEELSSNRHNCSGKHTGMVAFARMLGLPYGLENHPYIAMDHPIQKQILKTFAEMCSLPVNAVRMGVDGCSAPNFAVPLRNAALGFARLSDPAQLSESRGEACQKIFKAMTTYPVMVGGPGSFDTSLMQATSGKIVCKGGAEGYQAMGIRAGTLGPGSPGLGITLKVSDGDDRGRVRPAVALEILRQLGAITAEEIDALTNYGPTFDLFNWRKVLVGKAYPCFELKRS
jgi:L-asparaginase II